MEPIELLCAIIIVLVIIIIVYTIITTPDNWNVLHPGFWLSNLENPFLTYKRSKGYFDHPAQVALERAKHKNTAGGHALAATIISENILSPQILQPRDQPNQLTNAELNALADEATRHYALALTMPRHVVRVDENRPRLRANVYLDEYAGRGFIYDDHPQMILMGAIRFVDLMETLMADDTAYLHTLIEEKQNEIIEDRKEKAKHNAPSLAAATINYIKIADKKTNDAQNVHDAGTLAHCRGIIDRLKNEANEIMPKYAIKQEIADSAAEFSNNRPLFIKDVFEVLDRMSIENKIFKLDASDEECLCLVWSRAAKADNSKEMKQAIFDALYDCWEVEYNGRNIVCATGRALRVIGALATLDKDQRNWNISTLEEHKNDILRMVGVKIIEVAKELRDSEDAELRKSAFYYLAETPAQLAEIGEPSEAGDKKLNELMIAAIDETISKYMGIIEKRGMAPLDKIYVDSIRKDAVSAIML